MVYPNPRLATLPCERMRGCSFAENFISEARAALNNGTSWGSGNTVDHGLTVDGTSRGYDFGIVSQPTGVVTVILQFSADTTQQGTLITNTHSNTAFASFPGDRGFRIWLDTDGVRASYGNASTMETPLEVDLDFADGEVHTITYIIGATGHTLYVDDLDPATASTTIHEEIGADYVLRIEGTSTRPILSLLARYTCAGSMTMSS